MRRGVEPSQADGIGAEGEYLMREEIMTQAIGWLMLSYRETLLQLQPDEVRMRDIVTLPKARAESAKAKRAPIIEKLISGLQEMVKSGDIAPNFFGPGVSGMAEFAGEVLEKTVELLKRRQYSEAQ